MITLLIILLILFIILIVLFLICSLILAKRSDEAKDTVKNPDKLD